ncbi:TRAP transporter large permease [Desulfatitalea tepidiphila]|uniref:TRAP transporter large permease n=1 Tax=Desulfatitalea tepidiphila TaxID=1185843 RepID=UPI0006B590D0|nr:TRAP transporter large permease subunit [Desulfatitalea tepidiphila]
MDIELVTVLMFLFFIVGLFIGIPLAFVLGAIGVVFTIGLWGVNGLYVVPSLTWQMMGSEVLIAVPLFVLMGAILQRSGIADDLYDVAYKWAGSINGGLGAGTIVICALFAAMAGIAGAATVSLGLIALPAMRKRGYDTRLSIGTIAAGGTLGILIPPSVPMIFYALFARMSIGQLFLAGILPGVLFALLLGIYILIKGKCSPNTCPSIPFEERASLREKFAALPEVLPSIILIILVLGSIFSGIATPTESASVGVVGSFIIALIKRKVDFRLIRESTFQTVHITTMVIWVMMGAAVFAAVYQALGASQLVQKIAVSGDLSVNRWFIMAIIIAILFIVGMFLDASAIVILFVPTLVPLITQLGFDPLWFSVIFIISLMVGYLSPPFGLSLFYIKGIVPPDVSDSDIYTSVLPFIGVFILGTLLLILFPSIVLWLPKVLM